jgi:hypothetical protein
MEKMPPTSLRVRAATALAAVLIIALGVGASSRAQDPAPRDLLPDIQSAVPDHVVIDVRGNRAFIGFNSALINTGEGPLEVEGTRSSTSQPGMSARQFVTRTDGTKAPARNVGSLRYVKEKGHRYWHLDDVMSYELRSFDTFALVYKGTRRGYCLRDGATYSHFCGRSQSRLLSLIMGVAPAKRSRWAPLAEGQAFEATHLKSGRYWIVLRADPNGRFAESDTTNDTSAALVDFTNDVVGRAHHFKLVTLGGCPGAERCDHPQSFAK